MPTEVSRYMARSVAEVLSSRDGETSFTEEGPSNIDVMALEERNVCLGKGIRRLVELASPVREPYGGPGLECDRSNLTTVPLLSLTKTGTTFPPSRMKLVNQ